MTRRELVLALAAAPGIGAGTIVRTLTRVDILGVSTDELVRVGKESLVETYKWKPTVAEKWVVLRDKLVRDARLLKEELDRHGASVITASDAHYPTRLEELDERAPGVLFVYGNTQLLSATTFSVLMSRNAPEAALSLSEQIVEEGVFRAWTLVSGHDTPEYRRSAVVPLRWGAPRILVLDRGFFQVLGRDLRNEPFREARLWRSEFDATTDLIISAVHPLRDYHPNSNRTRDLVVAGLGVRLFFSWISPGGNMERLARKALQHGRETWVGDLGDESRGLIRNGARVIDESFWSMT